MANTLNSNTKAAGVVLGGKGQPLEWCHRKIRLCLFLEASSYILSWAVCSHSRLIRPMGRYEEVSLSRARVVQTRESLSSDFYMKITSKQCNAMDPPKLVANDPGNQPIGTPVAPIYPDYSSGCTCLGAHICTSTY